MGCFGSLQGKKSPNRRFLGLLSAKRNKLTGGVMNRIRRCIEQERGNQNRKPPERHKKTLRRYPVISGGRPKKAAGCAGMLFDMTPVLCKAEW
jgi:hypothetical protein